MKQTDEESREGSMSHLLRAASFSPSLLCQMASVFNHDLRVRVCLHHRSTGAYLKQVIICGRAPEKHQFLQSGCKNSSQVHMFARQLEHARNPLHSKQCVLEVELFLAALNVTLTFVCFIFVFIEQFVASLCFWPA